MYPRVLRTPRLCRFGRAGREQTRAVSDADVDGFLALLAARRAPRTVDAYRRDLASLRTFLGKPVAQASVEELEAYVAQLRAEGLSTATIARRTAAFRSFFRH